MGAAIDEGSASPDAKKSVGGEARPRYYRVAHHHAVAVHETMSLASAAACFKAPGSVLRGTAAESSPGEHAWVRLCSGEGYVLLEHPTDGTFLQALEPASFKVAHKALLVRKEASTSASVLQIKKEGDTLLVDGHLEGWLKVHSLKQASPDADSDMPGSAGGLVEASGWVMIQHPTYGKLVQYLRGNVPTFTDPLAFEGAMDATPSSVYTGKAADPLTERMKLELDKMRGVVREKETASDQSRDVNFDLIRRGLMSNAGQSSSHSFCVEGNPL